MTSQQESVALVLDLGVQVGMQVGMPGEAGAVGLMPLVSAASLIDTGSPAVQFHDACVWSRQCAVPSSMF